MGFANEERKKRTKEKSSGAAAVTKGVNSNMTRISSHKEVS